jgi:hypothetical protein
MQRRLFIEYAAAAGEGQHYQFILRCFNDKSLPNWRRCELATFRFGVWGREPECYVVDLAVKLRDYWLGYRTLHCAQ